MGEETYEAKCPNCGTVVYHDKETWCKCDSCGSRVWFDKKLQKKYGNPIPSSFRGKETSEKDANGDKNETTLDDF